MTRRILDRINDLDPDPQTETMETPTFPIVVKVKPINPATSEDLTERERQVAIVIGLGLSNKETAGVLGISIKTIEKHRQRIYGLFKLHDHPDIMKFAIKSGLITLEQWYSLPSEPEKRFDYAKEILQKDGILQSEKNNHPKLDNDQGSRSGVPVEGACAPVGEQPGV